MAIKVNFNGCAIFPPAGMSYIIPHWQNDPAWEKYDVLALFSKHNTHAEDVGEVVACLRAMANVRIITGARFFNDMIWINARLPRDG